MFICLSTHCVFKVSQHYANTVSISYQPFLLSSVLTHFTSLLSPLPALLTLHFFTSPSPLSFLRSPIAHPYLCGLLFLSADLPLIGLLLVRTYDIQAAVK